MTIKSPHKVVELNDSDGPSNNNIAPKTPKHKPITFNLVTFSFNKKKEKKATNSGVVTIKIAALIGVVIAKPLKNKSMFAATPNTAHFNNIKKSFLPKIDSFTNKK